MPHRSSLVAACALALAGGLGACGDGAGAAGGAPTDASRTAFCRAFAGPRKVSDPHRLGTVLTRVGTPRDIGDAARHGFEVLVDRLGAMPAHANKGDLGQMTKSLTGADQRDVVAFATYYVKECRGLPSGFSP